VDPSASRNSSEQRSTSPPLCRCPVSPLATPPQAVHSPSPRPRPLALHICPITKAMPAASKPPVLVGWHDARTGLSPCANRLKSGVTDRRGHQQTASSQELGLHAFGGWQDARIGLSPCCRCLLCVRACQVGLWVRVCVIGGSSGVHPVQIRCNRQAWRPQQNSRPAWQLVLFCGTAKRHRFSPFGNSSTDGSAAGCPAFHTLMLALASCTLHFCAGSAGFTSDVCCRFCCCPRLLPPAACWCC
jgi:hypothetical protein